MKQYLPLSFRRAGGNMLDFLGLRQKAIRHDFVYRDEAPMLTADMGWFEHHFWANKGRVIHKWHHYLPIYERHFSPWRDRAPRMLEIGVQNGGSGAMWRSYFGPDARIFGVDIDPRCAELDGETMKVRIGSQADPEFLLGVIDEVGGVDIVLDDGSHVMSHIRASFQTLFPRLSDGGIYFVEDLHTAYWRSFEGGLGRKATFIEISKGLVDDMHHWYHGEGVSDASSKDRVSGIHFYDSIVVIDKASLSVPKHSATGRDAGVVDVASELRADRLRPVAGG